MTTDPYLLTLAIVVAAVATARLTRLVVDDTWPPVKRFREWYVQRVSTDWELLVECPFCASAYIALAQAIYAVPMFIWPEAWWLSGPWWFVNGLFALMYVAAVINTRDLPPEQR